MYFTLHLQVIFQNPTFQEKMQEPFSSNHRVLIQPWNSYISSFGALLLKNIENLVALAKFTSCKISTT